MSLIFGAAVLGLLAGGVYGVMASGIALTFGVMRIINIGHAALVVAGAFLTYELFSHFHVDPFLGLLITMPMMFLVGVVLEVIFIRPLKTDREEMSVLVTVGIALMIEGVLGYFFGTDLVQVTTSYSTSTFSVAGVYIPWVYVYGFALAIACMAALAFLLQRTTFGAAIRATTLNKQAAELIGIDTERVSAVAFGIGAALAAAGGAVYAIVNAFYPDSYYDLVGHLLTIVVLGGLGSMRGAFLAALFVIVIQDVMSVVISPNWAELTYFVVLMVVLILRPQGFFALRVREVF